MRVKTFPTQREDQLTWGSNSPGVDIPKHFPQVCAILRGMENTQIPAQTLNVLVCLENVEVHATKTRKEKPEVSLKSKRQHG